MLARSRSYRTQSCSSGTPRSGVKWGVAHPLGVRPGRGTGVNIGAHGARSTRSRSIPAQSGAADSGLVASTSNARSMRASIRRSQRKLQSGGSGTGRCRGATTPSGEGRTTRSRRSARREFRRPSPAPYTRRDPSHADPHQVAEVFECADRALHDLLPEARVLPVRPHRHARAPRPRGGDEADARGRSRVVRPLACGVGACGMGAVAAEAHGTRWAKLTRRLGGARHDRDCGAVNGEVDRAPHANVVVERAAGSC